MRLSNISSFEIVTDRFVEATQMLRAYASNPQQGWHFNSLRERMDSVHFDCQPIHRLTGTMTTMHPFAGQPLKPAGTSGTSQGPRGF